MKQMLLTKELREALPPVYSGEKVPMKERKFPVKFFSGSWTWYACEFDGEDQFFGYVVGDCTELGYFSLLEMEDINRRAGYAKIERDKFWDKNSTGADVAEDMRQHGAEIPEPLL